MIRAAGILVVALAVAAGGYVLLAGGQEPPRYRVVLDTANGLTEGVDLRVGGVRVGAVDSLGVERDTKRAVATVVVERKDFGQLREDAFCRVQPQSLIGEYFLNCEAGQGDPLRDGATIPIEQTGTTIAPDLVNNMMRRPWRERLGLLFTEFGTGLAARGPELDAVIQRAIPALRETNRVLAILADNRAELQSLTREADIVMARLSGNRDNVARFVSEARDTARASANRRFALAETIDRFPGFLRELRPTLRSLDRVADRQTPALRDLRRSAPTLRELFARIGPFSEAARPAVRSLGEASVVGRRAVRDARGTVEQVRRLGRAARDPMTNLRFILEHLDDRKFAVELSPVYGGRRFTGLEAILQYFFVQSQAINIFDQRGYLLKLNVLINECTAYTDAETARAEPERTRRCSAALGPSAPGVNQPDPSPGGAGSGGSSPEGGNDGEGESAEGPVPGLNDLPLPASPRATPTAERTALADYLLGP